MTPEEAVTVKELGEAIGRNTEARRIWGIVSLATIDVLVAILGFNIASLFRAPIPIRIVPATCPEPPPPKSAPSPPPSAAE